MVFFTNQDTLAIDKKRKANDLKDENECPHPDVMKCETIMLCIVVDCIPTLLNYVSLSDNSFTALL